MTNPVIIWTNTENTKRLVDTGPCKNNSRRFIYEHRTGYDALGVPRWETSLMYDEIIEVLITKLGQKTELAERLQQETANA